MPNGPRFDRWDWLTLLASLLGGIALALLVLVLLLRTVLEPALVSEGVIRINRSTGLVEEVLRRVPVESLPEGVMVRRVLPDTDRAWRRPSAFDAQLMRQLALKQGQPRELRRDRPPLEDPWGGYWIRLNPIPGREIGRAHV
mgnify:CR=1 FL=1